MVAVVKSYKIEGLNETNVMPIWWHTSHWRKQYPWEESMETNFDIQSLCQSTANIDQSYVLCPPYPCPQKGGCPREEKRIKGGVEIAMEKKGKISKKKRDQLKCDIPNTRCEGQRKKELFSSDHIFSPIAKKSLTQSNLPHSLILFNPQYHT
jgi:hypothetical protein